ncbi:MAG TPA: hypothetical protein VJ715_07245 [Pyrinomonadaceae bacterium]|nr:hypothetical protein [Pyrinomonadaceae bacterium]
MMRHPHIKRLLAASACLVLILALTPRGLAQEGEPLSVATKFDEFQDLRWCDLSARLDNYAIALQGKADLEGYIVTYGPEGNNPGSGKTYLRILQDYLVNSRGIFKGRFKTVYGGRYQNLTELKTELWIAPQGVRPPDLKEYENDSASFTGKFAEFETYDGPYESEGPSVDGPIVAGFTDSLRQQPKKLAYVVARDSPAAPPGAWRRSAKDVAGQISGHGVAADRVKIIFAGYEKLGEYSTSKIELWILPEGAPPPAREAGAERRPEKAVRLSNFNSYYLGNAAQEKTALEGFADVLRADDQLSACLILRISTGPPAEPALDRPKEPSAEDFMRLIERWKSELVTNYQIDQTRLIVTVALETEQYPGGSIETWIVPKGAPLPDPYPPREEIEEFVEEENPPSF